MKLTRGNLLEADTDALVNTVNTVGVMGKGVALQFKKAFPENFQAYKNACDKHEVRTGTMFVYEFKGLNNPRYIVNFPTKKHWRGKSKLSDIEAGLRDLKRVIVEYEIRSIAIPPLGCGYGGLDWNDIYPRIKHELGTLKNVDVLLYEPGKTPAASEMPIKTRRPKMTEGRAAIIGLIGRYTQLGYEASLLEVQKLAYFMQEVGVPLRLRYVTEKFGPYADNLRHVLDHIEGHYIQGFGDGSKPRTAVVHLMEGAQLKADEFLQSHPETHERFNRVTDIIEGFETPYGMELLATVHWVASENLDARIDPKAAVQAVQAWSARKRRSFKPEHIEVACARLQEQGWLQPIAG